MAKIVLLTRVNFLILDIYKSLKKNNEMPENISKEVQKLSEMITKRFIDSSVYVDHQALDWRKEEIGPTGAERLTKTFNNCKKKVNEMFKNIADKDGIQLVIHWGQWAFRVRQGLFFQQN